MRNSLKKPNISSRSKTRPEHDRTLSNRTDSAVANQTPVFVLKSHQQDTKMLQKGWVINSHTAQNLLKIIKALTTTLHLPCFHYNRIFMLLQYVLLRDDHAQLCKTIDRNTKKSAPDVPYRLSETKIGCICAFRK